jgi:predicted RNA-binding protein YlxR (DUF448 family)
VVLGDDGHSLVVDERRRAPGRGAWLHPEPGCLDLAERRRVFSRALRAAGPVDLTGARAWFDRLHHP